MTDFYDEITDLADELSEKAGKLRRRLTDIDARGNAADACQLGKAIALAYIAEKALNDASSTLGRTTPELWK